MRAFFLVAVSAVIVGCSSETADVPPTVADTGSVTDTGALAIDSATEDTSVVNDASTDVPAEAAPDVALDTAMPDSAKGDTVEPDGGRCMGASDCRLFSSYCASAPCRCIPLLKGEANPKCEGGTVTCLVDPCAGKLAACTGGSCAVSP